MGSSGGKGLIVNSPARLSLPQAASGSIPTVYLGKGLYDGNGQLIKVFGQPFNTPMPVPGQYSIYEPTTNLNISSIYPGMEAIVAIVKFTNFYTALEGTVSWYRDRDGVMVYSYPFSIDAPESGEHWVWFNFWTYIGYAPWEIDSNGTYRLVVEISGIEYSYPFTVTGARRIVGNYSDPNVMATVTNTTRKGGSLVGVPLGVQCTVTTSIGQPLPPSRFDDHFDPGEQRVMSWYVGDCSDYHNRNGQIIYQAFGGNKEIAHLVQDCVFY